MQPLAFLSRETGQRVVAADRAEVGRLVDLTVGLHVSHPVVHRALVGSGRNRYFVPWSLVQRFDDRELLLAAERADLEPYAVVGEPALEDRELRLCRDVLDTQVVDLAGLRLARVSDVLLVHRSDGRIEIAAVDIGLGSLLRRMGLGLLGHRLAPVAVDWDDLHLTSSRGHVVQLNTSTAGVHRLDARGLAELLTRLSTDRAGDVIRTVGPARSAQALRESHPAVGHRLLHALSPQEAQQVIDAAAPESAEHLAELRHVLAPPRRRLLRTAGWRLHRPPSPTEGTGERR